MVTEPLTHGLSAETSSPLQLRLLALISDCCSQGRNHPFCSCDTLQTRATGPRLGLLGNTNKFHSEIQ